MKLSNKIEKTIITKMIDILEKDFKDLPAYELGLIDAKGNLTSKTPRTATEKKALTDLTAFVIQLKQHIEFRKFLSKDKYQTMRRKHGFMHGTMPDSTDIELSEQAHDCVNIIKELESTSSKAVFEAIRVDNDTNAKKLIKARLQRKKIKKKLSPEQKAKSKANAIDIQDLNGGE